MALFGLLLDYILPSSNPGIGLPQLLIAAAGIGLAVLGLFLRRDKFRQRLANDLRANLGKGALITLLTLLGLELVLTAAGYATYYPIKPPEAYKEVVDWFRCDAEMGCRYDYDSARVACEAGDLADRHCVFNTQGFADSDEFVASDDLIRRNRLLVLGDSYTHGYSADVGFSFVAAIEDMLPELALWNLGIVGTGTSQALASFAGIAPIMQPQLTILGFYPTNDYRDNQYAIEKLFAHSRSGNTFGRLSYELEGRWGGIYEVDPMLALRYLKIDVNPPPNELERLIGLTRLGAVLLSSMDAASPLFDGQKWRVQVEITRDYLRQLRDEAAAMDTQLLVLVIPGKEDFLTLTDKYTTAIALMRELAIPYLEVIDKLHLADDYHGPEDEHWNNSGHRIVGEILAECIGAFFAAGSLSACDSVIIP